MNTKSPLTHIKANELYTKLINAGYKVALSNTTIGNGVKIVVKDGKTILNFFNSDDVMEFLNG